MELENAEAQGSGLGSPSNFDKIKALISNGVKMVDSEPKVLLRGLRIKQKPQKTGKKKSIKKRNGKSKSSKKKKASSGSEPMAM